MECGKREVKLALRMHLFRVFEKGKFAEVMGAVVV